jgi:hypothetical protein
MRLAATKSHVRVRIAAACQTFAPSGERAEPRQIDEDRAVRSVIGSIGSLKPLVANRKFWPPKPRQTTPICPGTRGLDTATINPESVGNFGMATTEC